MNRTQQIITSDNARNWYSDYLRSQKNTWQRGSAKVALSASIALAIGAENDVQLIEGKTRRDLAVSINGAKAVPLSYYFV
jgi:hypothetical protein